MILTRRAVLAGLGAGALLAGSGRPGPTTSVPMTTTTPPRPPGQYVPPAIGVWATVDPADAGWDPVALDAFAQVRG